MSISVPNTAEMVRYVDAGSKAKIEPYFTPVIFGWVGPGVHLMKVWMERVDESGHNWDVGLIRSLGDPGPAWQPGGVGGAAMRIDAYFKKVNGIDTLVRDEEQWYWGWPDSPGRPAPVVGQLNWEGEPVGSPFWSVPGAAGPTSYLGPGKYVLKCELKSFTAKGAPTGDPERVSVQVAVVSWRPRLSRLKLKGPGRDREVEIDLTTDKTVPRLEFEPRSEQAEFELSMELLPGGIWGPEIIEYTLEIKKEGSSQPGNPGGVVFRSKQSIHVTPRLVKGPKAMLGFTGFRIPVTWDGRASMPVALQGHPPISKGEVVPEGRYTVRWSGKCHRRGVSWSGAPGPTVTVGQIALSEFQLPTWFNPYRQDALVMNLVDIDGEIRATAKGEKELPVPTKVWLGIHQTRASNDDSPLLVNDGDSLAPGQVAMVKYQIDGDEHPSPFRLAFQWDGGALGQPEKQKNPDPTLRRKVGSVTSRPAPFGLYTVQITAREASDPEGLSEKNSVRGRSFFIDPHFAVEITLPPLYPNMAQLPTPSFCRGLGKLETKTELTFGPTQAGVVRFTESASTVSRVRLIRESDFQAAFPSGINTAKPIIVDKTYLLDPIVESTERASMLTARSQLRTEWDGHPISGPHPVGTHYVLNSLAFAARSPATAQPFDLETEEFVYSATKIRIPWRVLVHHNLSPSDLALIDSDHIKETYAQKGIAIEFKRNSSPIYGWDYDLKEIRTWLTFTAPTPGRYTPTNTYIPGDLAPDTLEGNNAHQSSQNAKGLITLYRNRLTRRAQLASRLFGVGISTCLQAAFTNACHHEIAHTTAAWSHKWDPINDNALDVSRNGYVWFGFGDYESTLLALLGVGNRFARQEWLNSLQPGDKSFAQFRKNSKGAQWWQGWTNKMLRQLDGHDVPRFRRNIFYEFSTRLQDFGPDMWERIEEIVFRDEPPTRPGADEKEEEADDS